MARFLMRRLVLFILALIGISMLIFLALRILPGDVAAVMAGLDAPPERVDRLRRQMGLHFHDRTSITLENSRL